MTTGDLLQKLFTFAQQLAKDPKNATLLTSLQAFLAGLQRSDITQAVADLKAKQLAISTPVNMPNLPTDQLVMYAGLGDAQVMLLATDLAGAMAADVSTWLVEHALPILEELAALALPLLVAAI